MPPVIELPMSPVGAYTKWTLCREGPVGTPVGTRVWVADSSSPKVCVVFEWLTGSVYSSACTEVPDITPVVTRLPTTVPSVPSFELTPFSATIAAGVIVVAGGVRPTIYTYSPVGRAEST